jgi:Ca2+-binding EF-hand superfamily protein
MDTFTSGGHHQDAEIPSVSGPERRVYTMMRLKLLLVAIPLTLLAPPSFAADPAHPKPKVPEFAEMLGSILINGSNMSPYSGWFHASESRFSWSRLAGRFDLNKDGVLTADELKGSAALFRALDRDGDEAVSSEDLDWSPRSRYLQGRAQARGRFARMDQNGNGRITLEEWEKAFEQATKGKKFLTQDNLADLLYPAAPTNRGKSVASDGPSRVTLLKGLFSGEIGSSSEGPRLGMDAPEFSLDTHDKGRRISLADYRGKKPVVLIFGSFT